MNKLKIEVSDTKSNEIFDIISLFCESGSNPYEWSEQKWKHYYCDYPDGKPVSFVAKVNGKIVGHYGMLPLRIKDYGAMLGLHAYVSQEYRGLLIISELMRAVVRRCKELNIAFICGFANPRFTLIKQSLFKWQVLCWLGVNENFCVNDQLDLKNKKYTFCYTEDWWKWRFGHYDNQYISKYEDDTKTVRKQLLKSRKELIIDELEQLEGWCPKTTYSTNKENKRCQPFSIKILKEDIVKADILDFRNWGIEMGDSDTFVYNHWR
jgi:GNAT superfamily N-acetyltransferase